MKGEFMEKKEEFSKSELEKILVMYSELKVLFDSVEYKGLDFKAKNDVTFKGYSGTTEKECVEYTEEVIKNFGDTIYIHEDEPNQEMLPIYRDMYLRFIEKRTSSIFNRLESSEQQRKEFIDFVVYGDTKLSCK